MERQIVFTFIMFFLCKHREPSVSIIRSVDEVWYKRAVEQHAVENESFVYSVPYKDSEFLNDICSKTRFSHFHSNRLRCVYKCFILTVDSLVDTNNLLVTASHAIFHKEDNKEAPVAVVGYQFHHSALHALFKNITLNVCEPSNVEIDQIHSRCFLVSSLLFSVAKIVQNHAFQKIQISNAIYWTIMAMSLLPKIQRILVDSSVKSMAD